MRPVTSSTIGSAGGTSLASDGDVARLTGGDTFASLQQGAGLTCKAVVKRLRFTAATGGVALLADSRMSWSCPECAARLAL